MNMTGRPSAGAAGLGKGAARSPASHTVQEPRRDRIGRAIFEAPGTKPGAWYDLSEERREPWRQDADRVLSAIIAGGDAIVPVNPTPAMIRAAQLQIPAGHGQAWTYAAQAYDALLKAVEPSFLERPGTGKELPILGNELPISPLDKFQRQYPTERECPDCGALECQINH